MPKTLNQPLTVAAPVVLGAVSGIYGAAIPAGDNACNVQLQNPGTCTIFIEGSQDGGANWASLPALRDLDNTTNDNSGTAGFTPPAGVTSGWKVPCAGCNQVRVRSTAQTGKPVVSIASIVCPPYQLF